jgi:hypothetical protein
VRRDSAYVLSAYAQGGHVYRSGDPCEAGTVAGINRAPDLLPEQRPGRPKGATAEGATAGSSQACLPSPARAAATRHPVWSGSLERLQRCVQGPHAVVGQLGRLGGLDLRRPRDVAPAPLTPPRGPRPAAGHAPPMRVSAARGRAAARPHPPSAVCRPLPDVTSGRLLLRKVAEPPVSSHILCSKMLTTLSSRVTLAAFSGRRPRSSPPRFPGRRTAAGTTPRGRRRPRQLSHGKGLLCLITLTPACCP